MGNIQAAKLISLEAQSLAQLLSLRIRVLYLRYFRGHGRWSHFGFEPEPIEDKVKILEDLLYGPKYGITPNLYELTLQVVNRFWGWKYKIQGLPAIQVYSPKHKDIFGFKFSNFELSRIVNPGLETRGKSPKHAGLKNIL